MRPSAGWLCVSSARPGDHGGSAGVSQTRSQPLDPERDALRDQIRLSSSSLSLRTSTSTSKGLSRRSMDGDRQGAVVAVALEQGDDPAVLDLALADADLELAGALAGVAEVDVLDVGEDGVEVGSLCGPWM